MGVRQILAWLLAACAVVSCGGGGGDTAGGFSISYDRSSVSATFQEDSPPPDIQVQATAHGTPPGPVYVGVTTANGAPDPNIARAEVELHGSTGATVHIVPSQQLTSGTHTGTLLLLVCADQTCAKHYGGSPYTLSYAFTVTPNVRVIPTSISLSGEAGNPTTQTVSLILPGGASSYTATVADSWATVDQITPLGFRVTVTAATPGTYATTIEVSVGSIRRTIPLQYEATPRRLKLNPQSVSFSVVSGDSPVALIGVTQLAEGQGGYTVTTSSTPWLSVPDAGAQGFNVAAASMPSGNYSGYVYVRSGDNLLPLPVSYAVTPPPGGDRYLRTTSTALTFAAAQGAVTSPQAVGLTRPSWNPDVSASIAYSQGAGWLSASTRSDGDLQFSASAVGLAKGVYRATITLAGAYPSTSVSVPVTFTVGDGLAVPASQAVLMDSESTASSLRGSIPVVSNGATSFNWSASSSAAWLHLTRAFGVLGESVEFEIDTSSALALPAYTDVPATVTINAQAGGAPSGSAGFTPVATTITLRRELAEVHYVGPGNIVSGKSANVIVRGRGFDHLLDPAARLSINGVTPSGVTRLSATSLSVQLPALAALDRTVSVGNALGAATDSTTLHVLDAYAYTAAVAGPTAGVPRSVIYDALRRTVYVANTSLSSIQRWRENGGTWTMDALALPSLSDIGLSPDGGLLIAAESSGKLHLIDPSSFTITSSYTAPGPLYATPNIGHGLAVTNDGKVWLAVGSGWNNMVTFDLHARSFATVKPGISTSFYGGPWYEVSRNGERLVAVQSASISPQPPLLYTDASVGKWAANPAGLRFFYWSENGLDETGSRLLVSGKVYDASFASIGATTLPDAGWQASATVLSPDGRRVYVFALPSDYASSTPSANPRIYVFDASVAAGTTTQLPVVGNFSLPGYPTCHGNSSDCFRPVMNISPDGQTLFVAGGVGLVVAPVPQAMSALGAARRTQAMKVWMP